MNIKPPFTGTKKQNRRNLTIVAECNFCEERALGLAVIADRMDGVFNSGFDKPSDIVLKKK